MIQMMQPLCFSISLRLALMLAVLPRLIPKSYATTVRIVCR